MDTPQEARARDERVARDLLAGPDAQAVLRAALRRSGDELLAWQVHAVHHRPGAGVSVGYSVTLRPAPVVVMGMRQPVGPGGPDAAGRAGASGTAGQVRSAYLVASTARLSNRHAPGLVCLEPPSLPGQQVHVWHHPGDPELPALAVACTPSRLMSRLGAGCGQGEPVRVAVVSYRPTRRAVVRVDAERERAWVKVLRPGQVEGVAARHRMLEAAGVPVPPLLRCDSDGLVVLGQGRGRSLASELAAGLTGEEAVGVFDALTAVLDALPAGALSLPRRPSWSERVAAYARAAVAVLPDQAARIGAVADAVARLMGRTSPGPVVASHGDFYEANVLMAGGRVSSLLDTESVGPGYRVDDLACLLGHVSVLDHLAPASYRQVRPVLETWTRLAVAQAAAGGAEPAALYARCGGVVLSLVAGARREDGQPWRVDALGRLAEAEAWVRRAVSGGERRRRPSM